MRLCDVVGNVLYGDVACGNGSIVSSDPSLIEKLRHCLRVATLKALHSAQSLKWSQIPTKYSLLSGAAGL